MLEGMDGFNSKAANTRIRELEALVEEFRRENGALREQVVRLTAALEEERRKGKRQAVPFSKGPPLIPRNRVANAGNATDRTPIGLLPLELMNTIPPRSLLAARIAARKG